MAREKLWKIGVVATCLGVAAAISIASWGSDSGPSDAGDRPTYWVCPSCGLAFQMSADEFRTARASGATSRPAVRRTRLTVAPEVVRCTGCGKMGAVAASKCPVHGVIYASRSPDGARGRCPRCAGEPLGNPRDGSAGAADREGGA